MDLEKDKDTLNIEDQPVEPVVAPSRRLRVFLLSLAVAAIICVSVVVLLSRNKSSTGQTARNSAEASWIPGGDHGVIPDTIILDSDGGICWNHQHGMYPEADSIEVFMQDRFVNFGFGTSSNYGNRAFDVEPNHTVLPDGKGVVFNVETVISPLNRNLHKSVLSHEQVIDAVKEEVADYYNKLGLTEAMGTEMGWSSNMDVEPEDILLEVTSYLTDEDNDITNLVFSGGHGFLAACLMAFAQHLPLRLSPDDLWAVIVNGFARHVNRHAEELRHNFVAHKGKKKIVIYFCGAEPGAASSKPDIWEEYVFPEFSRRIAQDMNNTEAYETLTSMFSTTTPTRQAAVEIALMATMKAYFEFGMAGCGIPRVQLDGTKDDWVFLRDRADNLAQ